jgi:hypothetical protein
MVNSRQEHRPINAIKCVAEVDLQRRQTFTSVVSHEVAEGVSNNLNATFRANAKIVAREHLGKILLGSKAETFAHKTPKRITTCQWSNAPVGLGEGYRHTASKKRPQKGRGVATSEKVDNRGQTTKKDVTLGLRALLKDKGAIRKQTSARSRTKRGQRTEDEVKFKKGWIDNRAG